MMGDKKTSATSAMPERKKKRLEKKMKKAEAFLALAESNDATKKSEEAESSGDDIPKFKNAPMRETAVGPTNMTDEQIRAEIDAKRNAIISRQKRSMGRPKIYLTLENLTYGFDASVPVDEQEHRPLYAMDMQQLLLYAVQGQYASYKPIWCRLLRIGKLARTCLVILDSVTAQDYAKHRDCFQHLRAMVPEIEVKFTPPQRYARSLVGELLTVPLSPQQIATRRGLQKQDARRQYQKDEKKKNGANKATYNVNMQLMGEGLKKTYLLLSTEQMIQEGYPVPAFGSQFDDFVYTQDQYSEVTDESPLFAIDCEMCQTTGKTSELTRVSVINEELECVYDTYVKPRNKITDYLTRYSGITKKILDPVTTRIEDVQADLRRLLPSDAIIAGQSLCFDLKALKMFHPYVIDTSVIYNLSGERRMKTSLKNLAKIFLDKSIQCDDKKGHSSVEDATATMELVRLKLLNGIAFGDMAVSNQPLHQHTESAVKNASDADSDESKLKRKKTADDTSEVVEKKKSKTTDDNQETPMTSQDCSRLLKSSELSRGESKEEKSSCAISPEELTRRATFMNNKAKFTEDFFQLLAETGKTMSVVDTRAVVSDHASEWLEANLLETGSGTKAKTENACSEVKVKDFTWVRYDGDSDNKEKKLTKLDKQIHKIQSAMPERSMLVVMLTGSQQDDAMTFVHIT